MSYSKDSDVDYKVREPRDDNSSSLLNLHQTPYAILALALVISFIVILAQSTRMRNLAEQNQELKAHIEIIIEQNPDLKTQFETLLDQEK